MVVAYELDAKGVHQCVLKITQADNRPRHFACGCSELGEGTKLDLFFPPGC